MDSVTLHLANSQLISDNKEHILNMNKRMKVRRKSRRLLSSSSSVLNWLASKTNVTSSAATTTTTKTMLISLLTLCHLFGITLCIGKFSFTFPSLFAVSVSFQCNDRFFFLGAYVFFYRYKGLYAYKKTIVLVLTQIPIQ